MTEREQELQDEQTKPDLQGLPGEQTEPEAESVEASAEAAEPEAESGEVPAEAAEPEAESGEAPAEAAEPEAESVEAPAEAAEPEAEPGEAPAEQGGTESQEFAGTGPRRRWYVIHTYSGHENKVKANLERAIQYNRMQDMFGEVLVVTEDYAVMKAGKKRITKRKTFPSYVLLEMAMGDDTRALVQNIPGVTHFVGERRPAPLSEAEVRRIRGQEVKEKGTVTTEVAFKIGESVKVMDGPFADFVGTVDEINAERGKLRVMVSIFGRPTAVELDIAQVTTI